MVLPHFKGTAPPLTGWSGFYNKVKVAKRVGYGYRNEDYFFTFMRYLSIPFVRGSSPKKT